MAKSIVILLLLVIGICAKTLPSVPSDELVPPPEDQESIVIRFSQPEPLPPKSFFQRIVTWFGFNGEPLTQPSNLKTKQQQQSQKQSGYVYENPNKLQQQQQPQKQQSPGDHYDDPNKPLKLQAAPQAGYFYEVPNKPLKIQNEPQNGYHYDDPNKPQKLQIQPQAGYNYDPPPVKQQLQPQIVLPQILQPTQLIPQPTQLMPMPMQFTGYRYDNPLKLQKPAKLNDLVSSAASPTAVYSYAFPPRPFSQAQSQVNNDLTHPCNKVPWLPMFPSARELDFLRARYQVNQNAAFTAGTQNIQPIGRQPEKFSVPNPISYSPPNPIGYSAPNSNSYSAPLLPSPSSRPLRQPSIPAFNELPGRSTPRPFRSSNPDYRIASSTSSPIFSATQLPAAYSAKPFSPPVSDSGNVYINGQLISGGSTTGSIQTIQSLHQTHPITQSFSQPSTAYGSPPVTSPSPVYGGPPVTTFAPIYGPPVTTAAPIYGPPTNEYGAPPLKLTGDVEQIGSAFGRFTASQPFTLRSTLSPSDQSRQSSSKVEQKSQFISSPIVIADGNELLAENQHGSTAQVLEELHISSTPRGFDIVTTASPEENTIAQDVNVDELYHSNDPNRTPAAYVKKEIKYQSGDRETPLDLLDSPISHFRKTSISPSSSTPHSLDLHVSSHLPDFKYIKNTWKPLVPDGFTPVGMAPSTPMPQVTASAAYQSTSSVRENETTNDDKKPKKIQIIIPYTSKNHPSPFHQNVYQTFDKASGWSQSNLNDDIHDSQESQVVSSATPSPKTVAALKHQHQHHHNSRYLTKILAKNIRDLLKREHLKNLTTIDLEKLQKNIDGWTEQEYSLTPHRGSTISLLSHSKHIPLEYFTTTSPLTDYTTTDSPSTYFDDDSESTDYGQIGSEGKEETDEEGDIDAAIEEETDSESGTFDYSDEKAIQQAEAIEEEDFKRLQYVKSLDNNQISGSETRLVYETTTRPPFKATTLPPCSTTQIVPIRTTVLPSPDELWNKLRSLLTPVSEDRNEKVYVVTPQPHPFFGSDESVTSYLNDNENEILANFKSPRFSVRPTPGAARSITGNVARITMPHRGEY